jgi:CubicO group peptidase (beta-lactamase class C family)
MPSFVARFAFAILLVPPLVTTSAAAQAPRCFAQSFATRVRTAAAGYAAVVRIPGVSLGVVYGDRLVYADGVGYANARTRVLATPDTPYNVASITKVFTATLANLLVAEGRLDLDAPVSTYLPDSVRVPMDSGGHPITVRHLLTHSAGLPKNPSNRRNQPVDGPIDPGIWEAYSIADLYQALGTTRVRGVVGTHMEYSNFGYALLGHVVERVARQSYEGMLRSRLLDPLHMTSSGITLTPALEQKRAADYWDQDDSRTEQRVHARFGEVAGFIGLTSTVRDLAPFLLMHLGSTTSSGVVPVEVVARMATPQLYVETDGGQRYDMALGWFRRTPADSVSVPPLLWHTGEIDGHSAGIFLLPGQHLGVIVLQNLGGGTGGRAIEELGAWLLLTAQTEAGQCPL